MPTLNPDRWREISPYLDHALSLSGEERAAWLADFRAQRSDLFDLLEKLLEEHHALAEEHFLEFQPLRPGGERSSTGQSVGAYRLISLIGEGGMGSVWLAGRNDGHFDRQVAIKFLRFALPSRGLVERFKREGRILAQLAHPHIAELIDAGVTSKEEPYLVLEYVKGRQIDEYCDEHMLGVDARIELFLDVLGAVAHAHANLVVHRDIKPSNVLISDDGRVKLLDFGIAKLLGDEGGEISSPPLTLEGGAGLTPEFAAPEQITGSAITTATDVYALGVLLFLLLTGQHPAGPGTHSPANMVKAITEADPPKPSDAIALSSIESSAREAGKRAATPDKLRRQLRGDLDTIIAKALKKKPGERYASATAFASDLRRYLKHEPIGARPDTVAYRADRFIRRNRWVVSLATLAFFAVVGGVTGTLIQARTARRQRDFAFAQRDRAQLERDRANRVTAFMTDMFKVSDPTEARASGRSTREVLDKAAAGIETGLARDPELQAQMMHVMGNVYKNLGIYDRAQSLIQRAVVLSQGNLGSTNSETMSAMSDLSWVLTQQGRWADAEKIERQVLEVQRRVLGPENHDTLSTMMNLSVTLDAQGRHAEAEKQGYETLSLYRRVLGAESDETLSMMNNLAAILGNEGKFVEAEALFRETSMIQAKVLGPENLKTLSSNDNLAETLIYEHRDSEAEAILRKNLITVLRLLGPDHPETALIRYDLGRIAAHRGQTDQALSLLKEAVEHGLSVQQDLALDSDPELKSLHADSRFQVIARLAKGKASASH